MMKTVHGNLIKMALEGKFDVIIHGCNCFNTFGAGIALQIKRIFPDAYEADLKTIKGDRSKLGQITFSKITIGVLKPLIVVNGYTQYGYGGNAPNVDYDAIRSVMRNVKDQFSGLRIGFPAIGAGLGGGDWNIISKIIDDELDNLDYTYVIYSKEM